MADIKKSLKNAATDVKAGLKNVPGMYKTLYNQGGPVGGVGKTVKANVNIITTGTPGKSPVGMTKNNHSAATRAKLAVAGAASVTPLGPVVGFALGVANSKAQRAKNAATQQAIRNGTIGDNKPAKAGPIKAASTKAPTMKINKTVPK